MRLCARQGCLRHKPDGCTRGPVCPTCILFPSLIFMRKVSNHLKLLQGLSLSTSPDHIVLVCRGSLSA